jgi:hypothetical protein
MSANVTDPAYFSLPFKGRAGVGMGDFSAATHPIPHLTSPLKGEELSTLALMPLEGEGEALRLNFLLNSAMALT